MGDSDTTKKYSTFSPDLVSYFDENGLPPKELKLSERNRICFLFEPTPELFRLLDEWNRDVAMVRARSFCETQRKIKAQMFRAKGGAYA